MKWIKYNLVYIEILIKEDNSQLVDKQQNT
jgi:hypothetical protein